MIKNNSEHTFIFPEIPVKAICLLLQRLNQPTLLVHSPGTGNADCLLTQTALMALAITFFMSSKHLRLFFKTKPLQH